MEKDTQDAIFIRLPKTAGSSIKRILFDHGDFINMQDSYGDHIIKNGKKCFGHASLASLVKDGYLSQDYVDRAFKFCFVRNPWDRLVSLFFFFKSEHCIGRFFRRCKEFSPWAKDMLPHKIDPLGSFHAYHYSPANPQVEWLRNTDGSLMKMDFIGRFENLDEDAHKLFAMLGMRSYQLPVINKGKHAYYKEYYDNDPELFDLVSEVYCEDIEYFGYTY